MKRILFSNSLLLIVLIGIVIVVVFGRIKAVEYNYNTDSPSYSTLQLDNGKTIITKEQFFWIRNYRNRPEKLDKLATQIMCESIQDTVKISRISLQFARGDSQWNIEYLNEYKWNVEQPKTITKGMFQSNIPFQCE